MLTHNSMSKVSETLREGFFADKVVRSLRHDVEMRPEIEELLNQIKQYFDVIDSGRRQVSTGKLGDNAADSLSAYSRMLTIVVRMSPTTSDKKAFDELTSSIKKEVGNALDEQRISTRKMTTTLKFFQLLQEGTLLESASTFGWESGERTKKTNTP